MSFNCKFLHRVEYASDNPFDGNDERLTNLADPVSGMDGLNFQTFDLLSGVNVNTSGLSLYKQKTGHFNLEFLGVRPLSDKIVLSNNTDLNTVDFDVDVDAVVSGIGFAHDDHESLTSQTTTSTNWQQKTKWIADLEEDGRYRIGWSFAYWANNPSSEVEVRIQVDDIETLQYYRDDPTDDSNYIRCPGGGFAYIDLDAGEHEIDFDFKTSKSGKEVGVIDVRLEIGRQV